MIKYGASFDFNSTMYYSLMHICARYDNVEVLELLIAKGYPVDNISKNRETPLHLSAENGNAGTLEKLIQAGADINRLFSDGMTPIMKALFYEHYKAVKILLRSGANLSVKHDGRTIFDLADSFNDTQFYSILDELEISRPNKT